MAFNGNVGGNAGGGTDEMMLRMGLQYGANYVQQGLKKGEQGVMSYLPFIANIHNYFDVTNTYVRKKLGMIVFPFFYKFQSSSTSAATATSHQQAFGSFGETDGNTPPPPDSIALPSQDYYANDLYIPSMGAVTYTILSAYVFGLLYHSSVTTQYLLSTLTAVALGFTFEMIMVAVASAVLMIPHQITFLDFLSLFGYKYVLLCIGILLRLCLKMEQSTLFFSFFMGYHAIANSFLSFRLVQKQCNTQTTPDGRPIPRVRLLALITALVQLPCCVYMLRRPFVK